MILIDEEKAIKMGGGVVAKILTACTVAVPESAEEFAEEIIQQVGRKKFLETFRKGLKILEDS